MDKLADFNIGAVGAFMFKHIRAKTIIKQYSEEFRCIRHGHYDELIERVKQYFPEKEIKSPILAVYDIKYGGPTNDKSIFNQKMMCDFVGLINSQEPMHHFSKLLLSAYETIIDTEFETKIFQEVVLYELGLRNALCNLYIEYDWEHNLITSMRLELSDVIDELCWIKETTREECEILHRGRDFRNYIKKQKLKKSVFSSSEDALVKFRDAIQVAKKYEAVLYIDC